MISISKLKQTPVLLLMIFLVFSSQAVAFADFDQSESSRAFKNYSPADLSINIIERASANEIKVELCNNGDEAVIEIGFKFETSNLELASNNATWQGELIGQTCQVMNFSGTADEGVSSLRASLISSTLGNGVKNFDANSLNDFAYTEFSN